MTLEQVLEALHALAQPEKVAFKQKKFGIIANNALGIYHKDLKVLAKKIGKDDTLATNLFSTNIYEARLLCSKIHSTKTLTNTLLEQWVSTFENWEITDSFSMGLVAKSDFAVPKILEWTLRTAEFEKRAGFATMAAYCMADKFADNTVYEQFLPIIEANASDDRIYVKKAVNWALRSIGKRNKDLNNSAITTANRILLIENKTTQWIAKHALKELQDPKANILDYPRSIYRPKPTS